MMTEIPAWLGGAIAFLLGASTGSFACAVAWRLPREVSIVTPRSYCESCERALPFWANIPILAYLGLRGRCLMCGEPIPFRHFLAEISLAVTALYLFLLFPLGDALARLVLCVLLWVVAMIDYDWRIVPHVITFPGMLVGFISAWLLMTEIGWRSSLLGLALGSGVLFLTGELYQLVRGREGVGMGDVWLLAMIGAFLGWIGVAFTLFVGSVFGVAGGVMMALSGGVGANPPADPSAEPVDADVSILRTEVPFGPFLAIAAGIYTLFQPELTRWYLGG
jgi:leader peptidase (prepilin peptidase) / N-methyltransferase